MDQKLERFQRYQRRMQRAESVKECCRPESSVEVELQKPSSQSVGCQNDMPCENEIFTPIFLCNLFNCNGVCTAEVQCNSVSKIMTHKSCEANIVTHNKVMKDFSCDPIDQHSQILLCPGFHGISSMKTDENLINTTGVSFSVFNLLLNLLPDVETKFYNFNHCKNLTCLTVARQPT